MATDHPTGKSGLYQAILKLETPEQCFRFFMDVCSYSELSAMEQRYNIAESRADGRSSPGYRARPCASTALSSRVNRVLSARDSDLRQFVEESRPGPDDAAYVETYQGRQNDS